MPSTKTRALGFFESTARAAFSATCFQLFESLESFHIALVLSPAAHEARFLNHMLWCHHFCNDLPSMKESQDTCFRNFVIYQWSHI